MAAADGRRREGLGYPSGRAVPVGGVLAGKPIVRRFHRNAKGGGKKIRKLPLEGMLNIT